MVSIQCILMVGYDVNTYGIGMYGIFNMYLSESKVSLNENPIILR